MIAIWKYILPVEPGPFQLIMHKSAVPLSVQLQYGHPRLWARVDTEEEQVPRYFSWFVTGRDDARFARYLGTVLLLDDELVMHLHEVASPE